MDCTLLGSSVHGILQARILEWVVVPFSRGSSQPKDRTQVFCIVGRFFTIWATREAEYRIACINIQKKPGEFIASFKQLSLKFQLTPMSVRWTWWLASNEENTTKSDTMPLLRLSYKKLSLSSRSFSGSKLPWVRSPVDKHPWQGTEGGLWLKPLRTEALCSNSPEEPNPSTNISIINLKEEPSPVEPWDNYSLGYFFWMILAACGILVPQLGIEAGPLAVKAWNPNHWTAREFPKFKCYNKQLLNKENRETKRISSDLGTKDGSGDI